MQGGRDPDHAGAQYDNVGLELSHAALRKLNDAAILRAPAA
jgi:hypothetical protein